MYTFTLVHKMPRYSLIYNKIYFITTTKKFISKDSIKISRYSMCIVYCLRPFCHLDYSISGIGRRKERILNRKIVKKKGTEW